MTKHYGFVIVYSGEQGLIYNLEGQARIVNGPQRLFLWREKFENLKRFTASQTEYLVVKFRDGRVQHITGPCSMFRNPVEHDAISVHKAITLDAHEVVVVYRHNGDASGRTVDRYLEYGPKMFVTGAHEWLHRFCWHGVDPENKTKYIPGTNKFSKLRLIPEQIYYNVDEIRTSDNGLVRVKLMIFYEITDVEKMLGATQDPIGDVLSCINADVTAFTAKKTYADFVEESCLLNELSNYPHLAAMCKQSGISVTKIVFRGYFAAPKIQAMHDEAIEKRTALALSYDKEMQTQGMLDTELAAERERLDMSHKLRLDQLLQVHKLEKLKLHNDLVLEMQREKDTIAYLTKEAAVDAKQHQSENEQLLKHLKSLKALGVDVTKYLLGEAAVAEKVVRVVTTPASPAAVHLHVGQVNGEKVIA